MEEAEEKELAANEAREEENRLENERLARLSAQSAKVRQGFADQALAAKAEGEAARMPVSAMTRAAIARKPIGLSAEAMERLAKAAQLHRGKA